MVRFDVFGRLMGVERTDHGWRVYYLGADGKCRPADDIAIPDFIDEGGVSEYLFNIFHESASPAHPEVRRLGE
jgi:hypothetical protein